MSRSRKIILWIVGVVALLLLLPVLTGHQHLYKTVSSTVFIGRMGPDIDQHDIHDNRVVKAGKPQPWNQAANYNQQPIPENLKDSLEQFDPVAFVVLQDGKLVHESYWEGYGTTSYSNSWSMAKSIVGVLVGVALKEGKIQSVDQKVSEFLPEFAEGEKAQITIRHLLQMSSGILWGEDYQNPVGYMATTLYGSDVHDITFEYPVHEKPGTRWRYQGGNTLLLSFILKKVTGMSVSEYASEKLWKPMGAEQDALWSLDDEEGYEKAFCCFTSNARDFARFGQLWLDSGRWQGTELVTLDFMEASVQPVNLPDKNGRIADHYGYQWWMGKHRGTAFYFMRGLQGQYVFCIPETDMVVVRLGHKRSKVIRDGHPIDVYSLLDAAMAVTAR